MSTRKEQANFWNQKWQANDIAFNQEQPNEFLQRFLSTLNLKLGDRIFVPLCGKSIDMFWLLQQGYKITGVELSSLACKAFYEEHNIPYHDKTVDSFTLFCNEQINLLAGNFFDLEASLLDNTQATFDRAALIALPSELRKQYAAKLISLLKPNTTMLLISTTYNQEEMAGPPFSVNEQEIMQLYANYFHIEKLLDRMAASVPPHLQAKGLTAASEQVYLLTKFKCEHNDQNA